MTRRSQDVLRSKCELSLADFDAVAGRVADEESLQTFGHPFILERDTVRGDIGFGGRQIVHQEADVAFASWACILVDPDMHLQRTHAEPGAASGTQFVRFGKLGKGKNGAIKGKAGRFQRPRHGYLDMIDAFNVERQVFLQPGPFVACQPGPRLLASWGVLARQNPHVR